MRYNLKKMREKIGLTQAEIAKKLGIARTSYTNIELGTKNPSLKIALRLKHILKTNNDNIFLNISVPKCNTKEVRNDGGKDSTYNIFYETGRRVHRNQL